MKEILSEPASREALAVTLPPHPDAAKSAPKPPDGTLNGFFYCWTHGIVTHMGSHCNSPAKGHVPKATIQDRHGGATDVRLGRFRDTPDRTHSAKRKATGKHNARKPDTRP
jgi:hypothetical protein